MKVGFIKIKLQIASLTIASVIVVIIFFYWLGFNESVLPIITSNDETNGKTGAFIAQAIVVFAVGFLIYRLISAKREELKLDLVREMRSEHKKRELPWPDPKKDPKPKQEKKQKTPEEQIKELEDKIGELEEKGGEK